MFGFESMLEEPEGLYDEELSGVEKRRSSNIVISLFFPIDDPKYRLRKRCKDLRLMIALVT